jgi:hypothetical protein
MSATFPPVPLYSFMAVRLVHQNSTARLTELRWAMLAVSDGCGGGYQLSIPGMNHSVQTVPGVYTSYLPSAHGAPSPGCEVECSLQSGTHIQFIHGMLLN